MHVIIYFFYGDEWNKRIRIICEKLNAGEKDDLGLSKTIIIKPGEGCFKKEM